MRIRTLLGCGFALAASVLILLSAGGALGGTSPKGTSRTVHADVTPSVDISSSGPLSDIFIGNDLSCQVAHVGDESYELYGPTEEPADCGTFLVVGNTLYSPDFADHDYTATANLGSYTPFTPVSQTPVTGTGTSSDPYTVETTDDAGTSGLRLQETDSYVVGDEAYQTQVTVTNTTGQAINAILYRAGDCYLAGSDVGYGFTQTFGSRNAVGCSVNADNDPPSRIEEWIPLTGGNDYYEDFYGNVWGWIGSHTAFPNTCQCESSIDNGAGISWSISVPAGGSLSYSQSTAFSPSGKEPLTTTKTADSSQEPAGAQDGYTITISNPNPDDVTLTSITDSLPAGFSYVAGSSTGATTSDPSVNGQDLTWSGSFTVPADGSISLHFLVTVSDTPGDYFNSAGGQASQDYTVVPTGPTAEVTVSQSGPPACADITDVTGSWTGKRPDVQVTLAAPSCTDVVYDVFMYANSGDTGVIAGQGMKGDGESQTLDFNGAKVRDTDVVYVCAVTWKDSPNTALDTWGYAGPGSFSCTGLRLEHGGGDSTAAAGG
jgi:uncharacterized repeat protein (TIGR01451 family)